jgi:toxin ParE1/3/4
MEIRIEWSEVSEKQLKDIFDYYTIEANSGIARKIVNLLLDRVSILYKNPYAGPKEELLNDRKEDYRYLIESNYKIIYWKNDGLITIASVFDCRQNPEKMKTI